MRIESTDIVGQFETVDGAAERFARMQSDRPKIEHAEKGDGLPYCITFALSATNERRGIHRYGVRLMDRFVGWRVERLEGVKQERAEQE